VRRHQTTPAEQKQYDRLRQDQFSGDAKPTLHNVTLTARCREKRPMGKLGEGKRRGGGGGGGGGGVLGRGVGS
jgi:hypothetical protein